MIVGVAEITLRIEGAFSLKAKRQVLRSAIERIRRDFAVSIAEVDDHDLWNSSVVGVALATNDAAHAESVLTKIREALDRSPDLEIESFVTTIARPVDL